MATLPTQSFAAIVSSIAAGMQGRVSAFLNFAVGSVFLAFAEAVAGVGMALQNLGLQIALLTRLATSYGSDADSFALDWFDPRPGTNSWRIGAVAATGLVTFSRFTASSSAPVIPVGATVKTQDGTQSFAVYADPSNVYYSPTASGTQSAPIAGYVMPAQVAAIDVPVQSITPLNPSDANSQPGSNGNIAAGSIALLSTAISGIDEVTNAAGFTNGSDAEKDGALKVRFRDNIAGLAKSTLTGIQASIENIQTGLQCVIVEDTDLDGTADPGMLTIVVDDGSGNLPLATLTACQTAINASRAAGVSRVGVYAAQVQPVAVVLDVAVKTGYDPQVVLARVTARVSEYVNGLGIGSAVPYYSVGAAAINVRGVANIEGLSLNSDIQDVPANFALTPKVSSISVGQIS